MNTATPNMTWKAPRSTRYEGLEWIKSIGRTVQRDNYDLVYTAPLTPSDLKGSVLDKPVPLRSGTNPEN